MSDGDGSNDSLDATVSVDRARSEERGGARDRGPSRRSKSEGPPGENIDGPGPIQSEYRVRYGPGLSPRARGRVMRSDSDPSEFDQDLVMIASVQPSGGVLKNAISRISTEYRLQFAWPRGSREVTNNTEEDKPVGGSGPPRKSLSMGAIKPAGYIMSNNNGLAAVHKKRITDADRRDGGSELEPLVGSTADGIDYEGGEEKIQEEIMSKEEKEKPVLRSDFKTEYKKKFRPFSQYDYVEGRFKPKKDPDPLPLQDLQQGDSWYREVLELRKKAGEYKHRGWGTELVPQHIAELYNKQMTLWEQVSRRSSLSALSLASTTPRSISKEEKEKENNKKSSPTKAPWSRQSPNRPAAAPGSQKKAEKIEDNKKEAPRSRKETVMRHHLERTTGAADGALLHSPTREKLEPVIPRRKEENADVAVTKSPQKSSHYVSGRSQSVGPNTTFSSENRSPKRTPRPGGPVKSHVNGSVQSERRPRPTTLTTTAPSRTKSSSGSATKHKAPVSVTKNAGQVTKPRTIIAETKSNKEEPTSAAPVEEVVADEVPSEPEPVIDTEPVVKSPPEPTRVKSPEQILMRSPEPVNWTVPLDTGKTFTVTQNVREGELVGRPHSELKAWTPPAAPPAAPQSAPPQLPPEGMLMNSDTEKEQCDSIQASVSLESLEVSNIMQQSNPINNFIALSELSQSPNQDSSSGLPSLGMSETLTQPTEQTQLDVQNFSNSLQSNAESHSTDLLNSVNNLPHFFRDVVTNDDTDNTLVYKNSDFQNSFSHEKKLVHDVDNTSETKNIYHTHMNKNGVMSVEEETEYPSMQYSLEVDRSLPLTLVDTEQAEVEHLLPLTFVDTEQTKVKEPNNCIDLKQGTETKESQEQPIVSLNNTSE